MLAAQLDLTTTVFTVPGGLLFRSVADTRNGVSVALQFVPCGYSAAAGYVDALFEEQEKQGQRMLDALSRAEERARRP